MPHIKKYPVEDGNNVWVFIPENPYSPLRTSQRAADVMADRKPGWIFFYYTEEEI